MNREIQISAIEKLRVEAGDTLVVKLGALDLGDGMGPWIPSQAEIDEARESWEQVLPKGVNVIVTHCGTDLSLIADGNS